MQDGILSILEMSGVLRNCLVCHGCIGCWVRHGKVCPVGCFIGVAALLQYFHLGKFLCPSAVASVHRERYNMLEHLWFAFGLPLL